MVLKVKLLDQECEPYKKYCTDAGFDLKLREDAQVHPHSTKVIGAGIALAIPEGYVGDICPRSSTSKRGILIQGKIDCHYRGEVGIIVTNLTDRNIFLHRGERIAQCIIYKLGPIASQIVTELDETDRGEGGFGHTGRF